MADNQEKILAFVEAELKKNPSATTEELQNATKKKFPSTGKLSKRQFNARYALQIKRRKPAGAKKAPAAKAKAPAKKPAAKKAPAAKGPRLPRVRRAPKAAAAPAAAAPAAPTMDRDAVRSQFLRFASDITAAESRRDLVRVLANVDKYVDAVAKATR